MASCGAVVKQHSEAWFAKQEARLQEPYKNTKRYYFRDALLKILTIVRIPDALVNAIRCKYHIMQCEAQMGDYLGAARAVTFVGAPGVGKTFSASNFAVVIAGQQWARLQSDYLLQSSLINRWIAEGNIDKIVAFRALEQSYWYFKERESWKIPCLLSSVPIQDKFGRFSYKLTPDVALQIVRVPEYSVLFNDESGMTQGANTSKSASTDILDFYRCNRHFGDFILINTEQGGDGNGKYIRKVTDYNIRLKRQETIMAPKIAEWRLEKRKARFFKRKAKGKYTAERERYLGEKLYYREMYLKTIGFRVIPYRFEMTEGNAMDSEHGNYIFPRSGMANYDSRAYRTMYKCRNQELAVESWSSFLVDDQDIHKFDDQISA